MLLKITSKRQVTFPKEVMDKLHLQSGDVIELQDTGEGYVLKPKRFDASLLAPLRNKVNMTLPAPNMDAIRYAARDIKLRD